MDLNYTPEETAFREEVRTFLKEKVPARLSAKVKAGKRLTKADYELWHSILNERGWLAIHWPKEYGGTGWTPIQKHIFEEESVEAGTPRIIAFGLSMLGPVLIQFASEEHKKKYLPRILNGDDWWARAIRSPAQVPTWPPCRRAPSATATIMSSTARRPGRPLASTATDVLPCAHLDRRQAAGRHFFPAHRHEHAWHRGPPDHHLWMASTRSTMSSSRT